jgi:trans-aconitate methyltransferase
MKNKRSLVALKWKPESYNKLSLAQDRAALRILDILNVRRDVDILDVGCGDGKISAKLSTLATDGSVIGLDKSREMINYAIKNYRNEKYSNLHFILQDAQEMDFQEKFDLVFSSFALQWVYDKNLFFKKVHKALRCNGQMSVVIPLNISAELEYATQIITEAPEWCYFYKDFHPGWYFVDKYNLLHLVKESCFDITYFNSYVQEVHFSSLADFEEYVMLWFPYLFPLNDDLKNVFFSAVLNEYCKILPPKKDGSVIMKIPILSFIASKVIL